MTDLDFRTAAVLLVALGAVVSDVRTRRIPNAWTFGAAGCAILYAGIAGGSAMVAQAALGWVVGALLFFPIFALGGMGAGDVKLLAALGAWLGPADSIWLAMFASIAGGICGVVVAFAHGYLRTALRNVWLMAMHWRVSGLRSVPGMTLRETAGPRLAYAIPIAIGAVCTLWRH